MTRRWLAAATVIAVALAAPGCKKKAGSSSAPSPEVSGLAAVPASAEAVIGLDVAKLAASPIIERAVSQLLLRDADLAKSWGHIRDACKIDLQTQVKRVMLALGPAATAALPPGSTAPASQPVLLIATGAAAALNEAELSTCIRTMVGKGGGTLTAKAVEGRTLYVVKETNRALYFAFGRADTVILSTSEAYLIESLGTGKKAADHPELAAWLKLANQNASLWGVGRVGPRVRDGLTKVASGLKAGPAAFVGGADLGEGVRAELVAVMASNEDAKQLESLAKSQLVGVSMWAQLKSLGEVVQKVTIAAEGGVVRFRAAWSMADVNQLLSVLDGKAPPEQDSPPAPSGSAEAK